MAFSVDYVVESYADYLRVRGAKFWQRFQTTRKNAPESALAEAIVFRVLLACKVDPTHNTQNYPRCRFLRE
jgi:hypothetical protein